MSSPVQRPVSEQQVAGMFDRIAPRYDFLNAMLSMRQDRRWRYRLSAMVPYRPGGVLLDVATGTGDVLIECLREHGEYAQGIGVDISASMLRLAGTKVRRLKDWQQRTKLEVMSAERLNIPNISVDYLSIAFGLRNVVDKRKALEEFGRVLKEDGVLLILEFFSPPPGWLSRLFRFYFHHILPAIGGMVSDRAAYKYLPQSVEGFYSITELRQVLYELGFVFEDQVSYLFGSCRLIKARKIATPNS